ncbi:hypothetical protein HK101_005569, partial [Irineochytrium annulatum]
MDVPPALKNITNFLQRAQELRSRDPVVAYYCTFYAIKLALENNPQDKKSQLFLKDLLDRLEKEKAALKDNEAITNDLVGYAHIENFALKIFNMADNEYRNGQAS